MWFISLYIIYAFLLRVSVETTEPRFRYIHNLQIVYVRF